MSPSAPSQNGSAAFLAEIVEEFTNRVQAGESVDIESYVHKHPEHAECLRRLLPALALLDDLGRSLSPAADDSRAEWREDNLSGVLGDYRIVREVGKGGMGVVYEAEQISLRRRVALKVLPFAATMDARHLQRFHNEARAAAGLHHEHIVPVHAVGCERSVHFYAMQFIDGQTLAQRIAELRGEAADAQTAAKAASPDGSIPPTGEATEDYTPSPVSPAPETVQVGATATQLPALDGGYFRRIAEWGIEAAEALEYAHSVGVVHRDIKPANLMVDAQGKLWVTDFGLARTAADSGLTMTGDLVGTLRYMSPEQALAKHGLVDHRTDVYSLGVTLYELLTLHPAVDGKDRQEILHNIAFEEPVSPRRWNKNIPTELEIIVNKAMANNSAERYTTSRELADDLRRWQENRPILARPPSLLQKTSKWTRRHKGVVTAASILGILAGILLAVSTILIAGAYSEEAKHRQNAEKQEGLARDAESKEKTQRRVAEDERDRAEHHLYLARMLLAKQAWDISDLSRGRELLDSQLPKPGRPDFRSWEWYYLQRLCHKALFTMGGPGEWVHFATWSPDGKRFATVTGKQHDFNPKRDSDPEIITVWDAETKQQLVRYSKRIGAFISWSPDGQRMAAGYREFLKVWEASTGREILTIRQEGWAISTVWWNPDGEHLATRTFVAKPNPQFRITVWNLSTRTILFDKPGHAGFGFNPWGSPSPWSRGGKWLMVQKEGNGRPPVTLFDVRTGEEIATLSATIANLPSKTDGSPPVASRPLPENMRSWSGREFTPLAGVYKLFAPKGRTT